MKRKKTKQREPVFSFGECQQCGSIGDMVDGKCGDCHGF